MKLIFKTLFIIQLTLPTLSLANTNRAMIIFSGTPSQEFKKVLMSSLVQSLPDYQELTVFESDNPKCAKRDNYLIQFCINGDQLDIVHQDRKALKRTISKLVNL